MPKRTGQCCKFINLSWLGCTFLVQGRFCQTTRFIWFKGNKIQPFPLKVPEKRAAKFFWNCSFYHSRFIKQNDRWVVGKRDSFVVIFLAPKQNPRLLPRGRLSSLSIHTVRCAGRVVFHPHHFGRLIRLVSPFYSLNTKPCSLVPLLRHVNTKLRSLVPPFRRLNTKPCSLVPLPRHLVTGLFCINFARDSTKQ